MGRFASPSVSHGLLVEMSLEKLRILEVGAEGEVEDVTNDRDSPQHRVDQQVPEHAEHEIPWCALLPGPVNDVQANSTGNGIANPRNEANEGIQTEPHIRSGDPELRIQ